MKKKIVTLIGVYLLITPFEFILNHVFGGSAKYLGIMIIGLIFFHIIVNRKVIRIQKYQVLILTWAFYGLLTIIWTQLNDWTFQYFSTYFSMAVLFVVITLIEYDEKEYDKILSMALIGTLIISLVLIFQQESYYSGSLVNRKTVSLLGVKQDPNNIAATLLIGISVSIDRILKSKYNTIIQIVYFVLLVIALILTGSRGGFLSLILIMIISISSFFDKNNYKIKRSTKLIILLMGILGIGWGISIIPEYMIYRLIDFSSYSTGSGRTQLWALAWEGAKNNLLFGNGIAAQANYYIRHLGIPYGIHNTFLMIVFETGLIGFSLFITPIIIILKKCSKKKKIMEISFIISAMAASFFLDALIARFLWNSIILGAISINIKKNRENKNENCSDIKVLRPK